MSAALTSRVDRHSGLAHGMVSHVLVEVGRQVGIDEVLAVIDDGLEPEAA